MRNIALLLITGASVAIASLWVAICAAAPEFIWEGLRIAFSEPIWTWLPSALLVGTILAFFVEPIVEYLRERIEVATRRPIRKRAKSALFAAGLALAFAIVSICLHDALAAFISGSKFGGHSDGNAQLSTAIALVAEWALGPFAVTIAWFGARSPWLCLPLGIIGAITPILEGWLFSWPLTSIITTAVPTLAILVLGYRRGIGARLDRAASTVLCVGIVWLLIALLAQVSAAKILHVRELQLYDAPGFWIDLRFYIGWALGLVFAPDLDLS